MTEVAKAASATVRMSNHTEFDRAYDRGRIAQLRAAEEKHPRAREQCAALQSAL